MTEHLNEQPERRKPFQVETTVDADRDEVWQAMTVPEQIRQWFGWDYEGIDAEIQYIVDHVTLEPPGRMAIEDGSYIELIADGPRTIVRAVLPGPLDDGTDWSEIYDGIEEGWRAFFEQLRFLLQTKPQGRRLTIYLTGTATGSRALAVAGAGGQAWHASRYQRMSVDAAGHLVGVAGQAPLASDSVSPVAITVTTYGLADAEFAAVLDEWTLRWKDGADAKVTTETGSIAIGSTDN